MAHDVNQREMDVAAQVRSILVKKISPDRYELWMPENTRWSWDEGVLRITFLSDFTCQIARRMFAKDIAESAAEALGFEPRVEFTYEELDADSQRSDSAEPSSDSAEPIGVTTLDSISLGGTTQGGGLDGTAAVPSAQHRSSSVVHGELFERGVGEAPPSSLPLANRRSAEDLQRKVSSADVLVRSRQLWERFVDGDSNKLAWISANLIIDQPGKLTPLLMHGPNGCGKSFLAAAIAERLRTVCRLRRVVHMSSEQFTNDYMEGLRGGGLPMFRRKYRDVEALILDDIQFFIGKKSTLAELKHTLDNLLRLGKQIVFTADRTVVELQALGSDFLGRLRSGMVTPLFPLDEKTRRAVLTQQFSAAGLEISPEIIQEIASRVTGDGRILCGIAKRFIAVSALQREPLGWEQCWNAVSDLIQATQPIIRIADIERVVCNTFGLEPDSLQSASKTRSVSQPRMLAMFLSRKYTPAAYKEIGEYFGRRRHSTVISAEKTVEAWLNENADMPVGRGLSIRDALRQVEAQLQVG